MLQLQIELINCCFNLILRENCKSFDNICELYSFSNFLSVPCSSSVWQEFISDYHWSSIDGHFVVDKVSHCKLGYTHVLLLLVLFNKCRVKFLLHIHWNFCISTYLYSYYHLFLLILLLKFWLFLQLVEESVAMTYIFVMFQIFLSVTIYWPVVAAY